MKSLRKARKSQLWSTLKIMEWTRTVMTLLMMSPHQRNPFRPGQRVGVIFHRLLTTMAQLKCNNDSLKSEWFFSCLISYPGLQLQQAIMKQYYDPVDLHAYFGDVEMPKLEQIFHKSKPRFFKRTSSAVWHSPPRMGSLSHWRDYLGGGFYYYCTVFLLGHILTRYFPIKFVPLEGNYVWENAWDGVAVMGDLFVYFPLPCPVFLLFPLCIATQDVSTQLLCICIFHFSVNVLWSLITGCMADLHILHILI